MEELIHLQQLLKKERDEEFKQYKEYFTRNNIQHRKASGVTWYPVVIPDTEIGLGEYLIITVERTTGWNEAHQFQSGKVAALFSNSDQAEKEHASLQGTIKSVSGNRLKLSLNVDELPDWVDLGKLGINLLFDENTYKEMDHALQTVIKAQKNRLAELRDVLYGKKKISVREQHSFSINTRLNTSQNAAVQKIILAEDVAIVHGPPGTGKTTTLIEAIRQVLNTEKQVMVCAPSNTAVDLVVEKLAIQGISVLRLGNPVRVSDSVVQNTLDVRITQHPSYKELKNYRKMAEEYHVMAQKYKRNFGPAEREQRHLLYTEARKIKKDALLLEDFIVWEQLEKTQVIACTLTGASSKLLRDKRFSTVFIDEAAQALEPACWIPILRADRIILAGDHHQLPPTVKSKAPEMEALKYTLFEKCIELHPECSVMLNTQYRMHEHIMNFSSRKFYKGELQADETVASTLLLPDPDEVILSQAFTFIDTAGCGFNEILNLETLSLSNPEEAHLLLKHLSMLVERAEQLKHSLKDVRFAIISPYKQQVILIDELLLSYPSLAPLKDRIAVKTVDGFQGQEKEVVYISLTRSNENAEIGFLSDIRRMNVAMTRAKQKLVIIGDSATMGQHPFYKELLDYTESIHSYHSAWEFLST